jgi:hypothetical protein
MAAFELTDEQVRKLNEWVRFATGIQIAFPYTDAAGLNQDLGFGDYLKGIEGEAMALPLAVQLDEDGNISYFGEADPGSSTSASVWRIRKIDESGDPELIVTWAGGNRNFDKIWDNRLSLTYT